jgi:hypothetical protein
MSAQAQTSGGALATEYGPKPTEHELELLKQVHITLLASIPDLYYDFCTVQRDYFRFESEGGRKDG